MQMRIMEIEQNHSYYISQLNQDGLKLKSPKALLAEGGAGVTKGAESVMHLKLAH